MRHARPLVAALLLVALGGIAAALAGWSAVGPGASGAFDVAILGPGGEPLADATVEVERATALAALQAAAARAGLDVVTEDYPGMGTYVRSIGPYRAAGPSGWVYEVLRDGAWRSGDRSAAVFPLAPGDALRWSWTEG